MGFAALTETDGATNFAPARSLVMTNLQSRGNDPHRTPALDGLRTIAIALVILHHSLGFTTTLFAPGPVGVRIFFVLSGYLITGILARAIVEARARSIAGVSVWRAFVARRALRIFPLAYLAMGVAWIVGTVAMRQYGTWHLLYLGNLVQGLRGEEHQGLVHFWSLAVEEQFYLVWPVLLLLCPPRRWVGAFVAVMVLVWMLRIPTLDALGPWGFYILPWCRFDALAFGGLLAITRPRVGNVAILGCVAVFLSAFQWLPMSDRMSVAETGMVLVSGAIVLAATQNVGRRVLTLAPIVYLGTISYGLYVWSGLMPEVVGFIAASLGGSASIPPGAIRLIVVTVTSVAASALSWHVLERPLNELKRFFPYVAPQSIRKIGWVALGAKRSF